MSDDMRWPASAIMEFVATIVLIVRGELSKPTDAERSGRSLDVWGRQTMAASGRAAEFEFVVAEVVAMSVDERGEFVRPFFDDYDA